MFSKIKAVKVQKIIMEGAPSVIGTIKYNGLEDPTPLDTNNLPSAKPLFYNFSQYPAVNEVVYILVAPSTSYNRDKKISHYYLPPINVNGAPNHNAQPNELTEDEYRLGVETGLNGDFKEVIGVRPLHPYEGDIMLEGRYGQSIRFGSTTTSPTPMNALQKETLANSLGIPVEELSLVEPKTNKLSFVT